MVFFDVDFEGFFVEKITKLKTTTKINISCDLTGKDKLFEFDNFSRENSLVIFYQNKHCVLTENIQLLEFDTF